MRLEILTTHGVVWWKYTDVSEESPASIFRVALKIEAGVSSKESVFT
jgi:hypothetical protein